MMILHKEIGLKIFFGDTQSCPVETKSSEYQDFCKKLSRRLSLSYLVILRQVHGIDGICITQKDISNSGVTVFEEEGDFLITDQRNVGIGVLTADCLPIMLYDDKRRVIAAVHAGWRGAVSGIVMKVVEKMKKQYGCNPVNINVWFGPSVKVCCYEVQDDFKKNMKHLSDWQKLLMKRQKRIFYDNGLCILRQLVSVGILHRNVSFKYNLCTMCNYQFHSFRRSGSAGLRQLSVIWSS
jgi:polyphenol oxidase